MMIEKIKAEDITKEKCLWDVYLLARKIKMSVPHFCIILSFAILLFSNALFVEKDLLVLIGDIRNWSVIGFNFTVTTLGFLIAGFTIFATLSKPDMFLMMMSVKHEETGMPVLKYNFVSFMKVFIAFIMYTFLYLFIILFAQPNGIVSKVFSIFIFPDWIERGLVSISYCIIGCSLVYLLLVLKTFIFNIYTIIMNSIRWEHHVKMKAMNEKEAFQRNNNNQE